MAIPFWLLRIYNWYGLGDVLFYDSHISSENENTHCKCIQKMVRRQVLLVCVCVCACGIVASKVLAKAKGHCSAHWTMAKQLPTRRTPAALAPFHSRRLSVMANDKCAAVVALIIRICKCCQWHAASGCHIFISHIFMQPRDSISSPQRALILLPQFA